MELKSLRKRVLTKDILLVGHRGSAGTAPENTLASFRTAIEAGADMIETDVQMTSDGHIVAYHDFNLKKTGSDDKMTETLDLSSIKELDAGKWFSDEFTGEQVPLLSEILEIANGKAYVNIEIKSRNYSNRKEKIERVIGNVYDMNFQHHILFSSFDYKILKLINSIDKSLPTAAIKIPGDRTKPSAICEETGSRAFVCAINELNDEIMADANTAKIFIGVYPVDTKIHLDHVMKYGIKAVVSNYPGRIREYLNSR